jgi:hypothetical protein
MALARSGAFKCFSIVGSEFSVYRFHLSISSHMRARPIPDLSILLQLDQIPPAPFRKPRAKPTYRPHSKFSHEDDIRLRELVTEYGTSSWRGVAELMPGRNSRQCRERWLNYLNPALNTNAWTADEDALLKQTYAAIGPRWVCLTKFFPTRTDAMLKNRFQVLQRKHTRDSEGKKEGAQTPAEIGLPVQSPEACEPIGLWFENSAGQLSDNSDFGVFFETAGF